MSITTEPKRFEPEHYEFEFYYLPQYGVSHKQVTDYCSWISKRFASVCNVGMTKELNSEWILRTYNATKLVMASTLLLNSAEYCIERKVFPTIPYLLYYAVFNACRSLIYVAYFSEINSLNNLIEITHSKVLNVAPDIISHLNANISSRIKKTLLSLRNERELFSYVFPANGMTDSPDLNEIVSICGFLVELAELTGRRIQSFFEKHFLSSESLRTEASLTWQVVDSDILSKIYTHDRKSVNPQEKITWVDQEDWYRVNYIKRKIKYPCSILFTMTEGMAEDFFGAWLNEEIDDYDFNPDINRSIIFPIP